MTTRYNPELKERARQLVEQGLPYKDINERLRKEFPTAANMPDRAVNKMAQREGWTKGASAQQTVLAPVPVPYNPSQYGVGFTADEKDVLVILCKRNLKSLERWLKTGWRLDVSRYSKLDGPARVQRMRSILRKLGSH